METTRNYFGVILNCADSTIEGEFPFLQTAFTLERLLNPTISERQNIKIFEISTMNTDAAEAVYLKAPSLRSAPFHEQIAALTYHSADQGLLLSRAIAAFGIQTQLTFGNVEDAQFQWAYEHNVHIAFPEFWKFEVLIAQIHHFRPSHVLITDPYEFDSRLARMFGSAPTRPIIIGWAHSRSKEEKDWTEFDLMFATNQIIEATARRYGAKDTSLLLPGYVPLEGIDKQTPEAFSVGIFIDNDSVDEHTISMLQKLNDTFELEGTEKAKSDQGCSILIYLAPNVQLPPTLATLTRPLPTTREQLQEITCRLSAAVYVDNEENRSTLLPKTIFTLARHNTLLFVNSNATIFDELLPGYEVERYTSLTDLTNKIDFYRTNKQEYDRLIKGARARALRDHSPESRAYSLLTQLGLFHQSMPKPAASAASNREDRDENAGTALELPPSLNADTTARSDEEMTSAPETDQNENIKEVILQTESVDLFTGMELARAIDHFNENNPSGTLEIIDALISQGIQVPGMHLLRGRCIAMLEGPTQKWLARNAMREELRQSVDHKHIIQRTEHFLKPIEEEDSKKQLPLKEHLFDEWYNTIKDLSTLPKTTLYSIYRRARLMVVRNVPGDLIDIGCGDGGVALLLEMVARKFSRIPRRVIALDPFNGLTAFHELDTLKGKLPGLAGWGRGTSAFSRERTLKTLSKFESEIRLITVNLETPDNLEKIFASLKNESGANDLDFALVHMDVSTYKPTQYALEAVHPYLNLHGSLVLERGIGIEGVGHAINEFLSENQGDFRFVGEECDTIWISPKKGYGWTDSRVSTFPEYL